MENPELENILANYTIKDVIDFELIVKEDEWHLAEKKYDGQDLSPKFPKSTVGIKLTIGNQQYGLYRAVAKTNLTAQDVVDTANSVLNALAHDLVSTDMVLNPIRCWDCAYWTKTGWGMNGRRCGECRAIYEDGFPFHLPYTPVTGANDYCAWGKKRKGPNQ